MGKELTILVHGFYKNKDDMSYLDAGLKDQGFITFLADLPTTFGSLEECRNSLYLQVNDLVQEADAVNYVAHSMGGLITRSYIDFIDQDNLGKCVFVATPHNGTPLAKVASRVPLYSRLFRPVKDLQPGVVFPEFDRDRDFQVGLIAGSKNTGVLGSIFLSDKSDGRVEISSVKTKDADDFIVLPFSHQQIHHRPETLKCVSNFLKTGSFDYELDTETGL